MSGNPPSLLYLAIYNPTLRPDSSAALDDEDAEEQAQILFYTSRDRAVSRDKMLRQVGLAKALVNFAEIFHSTNSSQSVHSQTRRMITLSPEPNFWMHVTIELAQTARAPTPKAKTKDKAKGKAREAQQDHLPQMEYHDGSLHDSAVRAHLLKGYEQFKLTHGSFISILSSLGQQALELQLERFFTVWAWSWDLDKGFSLGVDLGLPLHPSYQLILPLIDNFSSRIPEGMVTLVLTQSYVAPSTRYRSSQYPTSLARHLMNFVTLERETITGPLSTTKPEQPATTGNAADDRRTTPPTALPPSGNFLGVSISMNMDVRKWSWPSFGKSSSPKGPEPAPEGAEDSTHPLPSEDSGAQVDQSALEDAITSDNSFRLPVEKQPALDEPEKHPAQIELPADADTPRPSRVPSPILDSSEASSNCLLPSTRVRLEFTTKDVFLAPGYDPVATAQRKVYILKRADYAVALLCGDDHGGVGDLVEPTTCLLEDIEKVISEDGHRAMTSSLPSVSKILQPKDGHIIKTGNYVRANMESPLNSDYLYEAKRLLDRDPAVVEVFSRGLHPQHWHVVARSSDPVEDGKGEAYLEVSRKEATLSDVDNVLRGLYKTHV